MMKKLFICSIFTFISFNISAQAVNDETEQPDTIINNYSTNYEPNYYEESNNIDSALSVFYLQSHQNTNTAEYIDDYSIQPAADLSDAVYIDRLSRIATLVHLPFNDVVRRCIIMYTQTRREKTEEIISLSDYYFPIFEEILHEYNLPLELKYMAVIESALNPNAVSRVGATGSWQFMFQTAKLYGLKITSFIDERRDPVASCRAAAQYMRDMYNIFGDWTLVIASYNCGAGNVSKAIRRAGGRTSYWDIYPYLPRETRSYVPLFIAATYTFHYYREHNLTKYQSSIPYTVDTVMVNQMAHFNQISEKIGVPVSTLRDLNPEYIRDIVPGRESPCVLHLPHNYIIPFVDNEQSIYAYNENQYFTPSSYVAPAEVEYSSSRRSSSSATSGKKKVYHTVKSGETLSTIAKRYNVRLSDIKQWNSIGRRNIVRKGQKLVIYKKR